MSSLWFTERLKVRNMAHRHSRVRKANDNAHVERFNRTIQEECLDQVPKKLPAYQEAIAKYLAYCNGERVHLGIDCLTPLQKLGETIPRS